VSFVRGASREDQSSEKEDESGNAEGVEKEHCWEMV
jgi:hypothetical protein